MGCSCAHKQVSTRLVWWLPQEMKKSVLIKASLLAKKRKYKLYKPTLLKGTVLRKLKYSWDLEIALDVADAMFVSLKSRCNAEWDESMS